MISDRSTRTIAALEVCAQRLIDEAGEELKHGDPDLASICTEFATGLIRTAVGQRQRLEELAAVVREKGGA